MANAGSLSISGVSKAYGAARALVDINLDVKEGEFVALLGPSGCGKTTLLRCIAGLISADGGEITVDSRSIAAVPPWKRDISVVFQSYALFPHMTVAENVAFGLRMRGVDRAAADRQIAEALGLVRMLEFRDRLPAHLSGGQQQRVALARAVVVRPKVLLLDEPLAALDAKLRTSVQREIKQLQQRLGITTILVTHDQSEAMSMSDRIAVMNGGRIEQIADPETLYSRPSTPFVAEFVGEINRLHGRLEGSDNAIVFRLADVADASWPVREGTRPAPAGKEVTLALRPEAVHVVASTSGTRDGGLLGTVEDRMLIGDRVTLYVRTPGDNMLRATLLNRRSDGFEASVGDTVRMSWNSGDAMIFAGHV
ncbi:ABC transporter ATP-binding protein [Mesorhizobium sp. 8]|uniref:ABC transporter ATP-binding protein n=1 Tax=Mesorhizobium sp. 8 TaxID=2584466 RepID=UPI001FEFD572|nr:ABC transporter ATP-binding protein [Mesorhizobium sp. 8]